MLTGLRKFLNLIALLVALPLLASQGAWAQTAPGTTAAANAAVTSASSAEYQMGPGDMIRISVFQNPDLTVETRISELGQITFPLVGTVALSGLSASAGQDRLAKLLKDGGFVLKPQVTISLVQVRSSQISILGQVGKPGRYPIETVGSKVSEMIAMAGGVVPGGADSITLSGNRNGKPAKFDIDLPAILQAGKAELDLVVQSGDILYVDRAPNFFMYGEVQRPGVFRLERGMTVLQALAQAGGLTARGTDRGLRVHRRLPNGTVSIIQPTMNDLVEREDVLYVRESVF